MPVEYANGSPIFLFSVGRPHGPSLDQLINWRACSNEITAQVSNSMYAAGAAILNIQKTNTNILSKQFPQIQNNFISNAIQIIFDIFHNWNKSIYRESHTLHFTFMSNIYKTFILSSSVCMWLISFIDYNWLIDCLTLDWSFINYTWVIFYFKKKTNFLKLMTCDVF